MASLPYMQLYVADFLADTAYLDAEESGAYLLLLMNYWQTEKPLPNDDKKLSRIARCSDERWLNVRSTVVNYFVEQDNVLVHERVERDLEAVRMKSNRASRAGKKSAEARKNSKKANVISTNVEQTLSKRSANVEQTLERTLNHKDKEEDKDKEEKKIPKKAVNAIAFPDWLDLDLWNDWKKFRQNGKTKLTTRAEQLNLNKLSDICPGGEGHREVIEQSIERGWKGFFPIAKRESELEDWANG